VWVGGCERQEAALVNYAKKDATHRRALTAGIAVSAAAHVVALAVLTVPGTDPGAGDGEADRIFQSEFEALEIVEIAEAQSVTTESSSEMSTADASGAVAPEAAPSSASLADLLSTLQPAQMVASAPQTSRPVVTFAGLEPVSETVALAALFQYGEGFDEEEENEGGGIGGFLNSIGAALSGGGHCPTSGTANGPLILRQGTSE
jgi:hypothetical protein